MLRFESRKFLKSKKFIFLLIFSIIISFYGFFFSSETDIVLEEYDFTNGSFIRFDDFFLGQPAPIELKTLEDERQLKKNSDLSYGDRSREEYLESKYNDNKWMLGLLKDYKDSYPQISSKDNLDNIGNLKWSIFKYEYSKNNKSYDPYYRDDIRGDNYIQRLILSSKTIFGVIPVIFFVLLFSDIFSKERESHTLNLLYSQPTDRRKIVFSKFIVIIFNIIIYIGIVLLMYFFYSIIKNIPISGGKDLYRILNPDNYLDYYKGSSMLISVAVAFFSISLFWSSFSLFFSTRFNSQKVVALMLVMIATLYSITSYWDFARSIFNPIYNLDIVFRLLGRFELLTDDLGGTSFSLNRSYSIIYYVLFIVISIIICCLSLFAKDEVKSSEVKLKKRKYSNLFCFESVKIFNSNSYKIYLLGCIFLIVTNFIVNVDLNKKVERETLGESGMFKQRYLSNIEFINTEIIRINNILQGKDSLNYYDVEKNKKVKIDNLDEDQKNRLIEDISNYQSQIEDLKSKMLEVDKLETNYEKKDGKSYYPILSKIFSENWESTVDSYSNKADNLSNSISISKKIYAKASKDNTAPLVMIQPFFSPIDKYKDLDINKELTRQLNIYSSSGPVYLFNLFWHKDLALILIGLVAVMVISGFTSDTEDGRQIEMMFTSSYKRSKLFNYKVLSQFIYSCLTLLFIVILIFILGYITKGIDGYNLSIANYLNSSYELIPLWRYLLRIILALVALIFFLTCLMNTISIFVKNKLSLLAFSMLVVLTLRLLNLILPASLKLYNPASFLRVDSLADQTIGIFESMGFTSYYMGLIVILVWGFILYFSGQMLLAKKKNII